MENNDKKDKKKEDENKKDKAQEGMDITSRSGAETELGDQPHLHHKDEEDHPEDRLERKEDLRRGLNQSNPNNMNNNSNTLNEN